MLVYEEREKPQYPKKNFSEQSLEPTNSAHMRYRGKRGEGKTGVPEEKLLGAESRTNKLSPLMTPSPRITGHIGGRRALSPLRQPCSPKL